jgi:hypothetical protein
MRKFTGPFAWSSLSVASRAILSGVTVSL